MENKTKKIIAREWLNLIIGILVGLTIVPLFIYMFDYTGSIADVYEELFGMLGKGGETLIGATLIILSPYLLYQLVRSIKWALKASKEN